MADIPKIRFKEFTEPWEQRKLGEIVDICSGRDYKHLEEGDIPVYGTGGYMLSVSEALSNEKDAIGIGRKGTIDKPYILKAPFWTVDTLFYCIPREKYHLDFTYDIFQNIDWRLMDESTGVPSLSKTAINAVNVLVPNEEEQLKIGEYFNNLDHLITLHQRKCDDTKELKKYMLQKMFPKNGEKFPEIRFKGFTEAWEQRKLGEILERRVEQRQQSGEYPRLAFASGQGVIPLNERKTNNREQLTKDEFTKKYLVTELDDIVYNPANVKYGAIDRNKCGRGLISPIYVTFTTSEIPGFIERIVTSHDFQQKALRFEEGTVTKRQSVNPEDFVTIDILVAPQKEEQRKISEYFDSLDNLITLHQRKCDTLKELKKYMLQNMFPKKG